MNAYLLEIGTRVAILTNKAQAIEAGQRIGAGRREPVRIYRRKVHGYEGLVGWDAPTFIHAAELIWERHYDYDPDPEGHGNPEGGA